MDKDYFNSKTGHVSPQAFKQKTPKKEGDIRKTSIYRTFGLTDAEVWTIGDEYVTKPHPGHLPILARADLQAQRVLDLDLKFDPDGSPHPRHANIIGWPDDQVARQMKAVSLASKPTQLVVR
jgi:hypothetical protein